MASDRTITERRTSVAVGAMGVAVLVAVLVPLLLISAYNHSYADDWHYGVWAHLALQQTGNVGMAIVTALRSESSRRANRLSSHRSSCQTLRIVQPRPAISFWRRSSRPLCSIA